MSYTCFILNQTGHTLTNVYVGKGVSSSTEDFTDGGTGMGTMELNQMMSFDFKSGDYGDDLWTLTMTLEDGSTYSRTRKQCNLSADDLTSPAGVYINLLAPSCGFSIETPVSDGCTDNSYDDGPLN